MMDRLPPYRTFLASDSDIREILRSHRTIAMIGLSDREDDPAFPVALELRQRGYRVLGARSLSDLVAIDEPVGIVNVLGAPEAVGRIAEHMVRMGAKVLWLEPDAVDAHAAYEAFRMGLTVILGRRILAEYQMHFPDDELGYPDDD